MEPGITYTAASNSRSRPHFVLLCPWNAARESKSQIHVETCPAALDCVGLSIEGCEFTGLFSLVGHMVVVLCTNASLRSLVAGDRSLYSFLMIACMLLRHML